MTSRPVFVIRLEAKPGTDAIRSLRSLLKVAGRQFHLRCVDAYEIPKPKPERTRAYENVDQGFASRRRHRYANRQGDGRSGSQTARAK